MRSPVIFFQVADGDGLAVAGTVDELAVFKIDAHMTDAASGTEKDQIALAQFVFRDLLADMVLLAG